MCPTNFIVQYFKAYKQIETVLNLIQFIVSLKLLRLWAAVILSRIAWKPGVGTAVHEYTA